MENDKCWAGDLLQEDAIVRYKERMKVIQSLGYMFQSDCQKLKEVFEDPNDLLKTDGDYPVLLKMTLQKVTHIETLCILNSLMGFLPMWKRKITDTIRYPEIHRKVLKYTPFVQFDKEKFRNILIKELL